MPVVATRALLSYALPGLFLLPPIPLTKFARTSTGFTFKLNLSNILCAFGQTLTASYLPSTLELHESLEMSGVQRSAYNAQLTSNKHRVTTKLKSTSAGSICDSMEDRRAQVSHGRISASDASRSNAGTRHALGIEKRKTANCMEVVRSATEPPRKARRTTPSVTGAKEKKAEVIDEARDRNASSMNDELDDDDTLSPELKELARIVGPQVENGPEWNVDWQCIYQEASPELKAMIDSNTKETSLKKNCRKNAAMFRSDPRNCLIGHGNHMRFKCYSEKFRNSMKGPDSGENIEGIKEVPLVKPRRCRKPLASVLEGRVSDTSAPSQVKTPSSVPTPEAHCGRADFGVTPINVIALDSKDPRACDALSGKDSDLPTELLELVHIVESQTTKGEGTGWDWNDILSQASRSLRQFITSKRRKSGLSRKSIVGEAMLPLFESFLARIRQERLVRDFTKTSREGPKERKDGPARDGKPLTVQADPANDRQGVTTASECSLFPYALKRVGAAANRARQGKHLTVEKDDPARGGKPLTVQADPANNRQGVTTANECTNSARQGKHLTIELRELAALIAKSKGLSWAVIESNASPRLKSFIDGKAREDPAYISAPLRCLVPTEYFDDFEKLVERNKVGGTSDLVGIDVDSGHQKNRKKGHGKDRNLGQVFALERRSRIKALTSNLRAELRAFEAQEVPLWDSFLREHHWED